MTGVAEGAVDGELNSSSVFFCRPMNRAVKNHCATKAAAQIAGRRIHFEWSSSNAPEGMKKADQAVRAGLVKIPSEAIMIMTHE